LWPLAGVGVICGATLIGIARGLLARTDRTTALGLSIAGENLIRLTLAVAVWIFGGGRGLFAVALLAGFGVVAFVDRKATRYESNEFRWTRPPMSVGAATVSGFLSIVAFVGPTLLVSHNGAPEETVSTLFLLLTAVRVPHLVLQSGTPRAGTVFGGWVEARDITRIQRTRRNILTATASLASVAWLVGYHLGDAVVGRVYAIRGEVDSATYAFASAASILSLGATIATVLLVAEDRNTLLMLGWAIPTVFGTFGLILFRSVRLGDVSLVLFGTHLCILIGLTFVPSVTGRRLKQSSGSAG
jgi:hypothetical protein